MVPAKPLLEKQIYAWVQQNPNGRIEDLAKNIQIDYRAFGFNSIHTFVQSIKRVNLQNNTLSIAAPIKPKNIQPGVIIVNVNATFFYSQQLFPGKKSSIISWPSKKRA